jgi:hypothetical protein
VVGASRGNQPPNLLGLEGIQGSYPGQTNCTESLTVCQVFFASRFATRFVSFSCAFWKFVGGKENNYLENRKPLKIKNIKIERFIEIILDKRRKLV